MKKLTILIVALAFATGAMAAPFSDVPRTHWAYDAIQKAVSAGILQGYDGKFHGKRLLNRYQMAVITAKLLDAHKGGAVSMGGSEDVKKMIANLEALTIEFADELALLNVKVSTLEDTMQDIKAKGGCAKPCGTKTVANGDLGFTAFASFGLVKTEDGSLVGANQGIHTRYTATNPDTLFFTVPQVSLGIDKEVDEGVFFHAQFDYASDNGLAGTDNINEAYFLVDEFFGDVGAKMGAFALPFSMEHNGPFRSCNLTITPSAINSYVESVRVYGLEMQKTKDVMPEDMIWKFGIVSGTDPVGILATPIFNDFPVSINGAAEADDGFGFYVMLAKKPVGGKGLGWNLSYFTNGGDNDESAAALETSFFHLGLEYHKDEMLFMVQYLDGDEDVSETEFKSWYFLFNYQIDENQSITLRYDDLEVGDGDDNGANAITFAYNRKVTDNSMMQFEYITPSQDEATGEEEAEDDLIQIRYKVHF